MMSFLSIRSWVLLGFVISIVGILLNVPVVSELNNRIRDVETELTNIKESLRIQANEISRADLEDSLFTILNHLSKSQTGEQQESAAKDSIYIRASFLKRIYAAAHDIPASDVLKVENEELAEELKFAEKYLEAQKVGAAGNTAEAERMIKEAEELEKASLAPKSELAKKLREATESADAAKLFQKSTDEIVVATIPAIKKVNEKFLESFKEKETKIKELEARKEYLSWWSNILTYLAISLQMFGLLCVLNKDLPVQEIKENIAEVKDDTKEVLSEVKSIQNESEEARNLLEELEEDLRSAIDKVEKDK
jgi:hypothetical protein